MRIGLFGGSFDPVHRGHLRLAECCREQAHLDEVWLMPTATQPLKLDGPAASGKDRLEMLRLATAGMPGMVVSDHEVRHGGVSYTVDTLKALRAERPAAEWFLLLGADALRDLHAWREPERVLQLAMPLVVHRAGEPAPGFGVLTAWLDADRSKEIEEVAVAMPPVPTSSSEVRKLIAKGEPVGDHLPEGVAEYISSRGLYLD